MAIKLEKNVKDYLDAWNAHDIERILSHLTDDVIYENLGIARVLHGKDEMRAWLKETFGAFPDLRIDIKSMIRTAEQSASEGVMTGTFKGELPSFGFKPTGKSFSVKTATMVERLGDKVRHTTQYFDGATMMQQLGVT